MSSANSVPAAASSDALAARCPLPPDDALRIWRPLLDQVAKFHAGGRLHGNISADDISVVDLPDVHLTPSRDKIALDGAAKPDVCPPEMIAQARLVLPTEITAAKEVLSQAGLDCDPRRIDVYQLALLCRMLTGKSVAVYLQSPRPRGKVPTSLRGVLDGALGYDPNQRFTTIDDIHAAISVGSSLNTPSAGGNASAADSPPQSPSALYETPAGGTSSPNHTDTPPHGQRQSGSRSSSATSQPIPERFGPYRIEERIGGGGMGDVYKAYEESLDRYVAIKVLPPDLARHDDFVRRFRSEALAVAKLVHPNVVQIHAFGEDAGHYYFAMQYVRGESLAECLNRRRLTIEETLSIVEQALAGLAAAHKRGLIHRDVKPGNILLDHDHHRALLADFGLVKALEGGTSLTTTGIVMGTVDYLPPEQACGQQVDGRADLYSLGVVMYQMLSGRLPFTADSPTTMIFKHAYEQPARLAEIAPDVPQRLAAIVTRLMAKNPDNRYQSAEEVLADIQNYRSGKPPRTSPRLSAASPAHPHTCSPADLSHWAEVGSDHPAPNLRDRLFSLFRRHAPQLAAKLEGTTQQVDGAIRQYERRHEELVALVRDAEEVAGELAAQVASHQEAAREAARKATGAEANKNESLADQLRRQQSDFEKTASDFAGQLADQQKQNDQLQSQLAQVAGTLQKLRSQRDVLQARLRSAQAQIQLETNATPARYRAPRPWAIALGVLIAFGLLAVGFAIYLARGRQDLALSGQVVDRPSAVASRAPDARSTTAEAPPTGRNAIGAGTPALLNASNPKYADLFPEQDTPFTGDLSGQWKHHSPAGYEYAEKLIRLDDSHYNYQARGVFAGIYVVRGNRLVMDRARAGSERLNNLWKLQWRIDDANHLVLIGQMQLEQIGANYLGETLTREPVAESIPPDAEAFGGHHYKLFSRTGVSWSDAMTACFELGGHLACATNASEETFLLNLAGEKPVWLGGRYFAGGGGKWKWITGGDIDPAHFHNVADATNAYLATSVDKKQPFAARAVDGVFRLPDDARGPARHPNIEGYICQWDD